MKEIITHDLEMPKLSKRRYQKKLSCNLKEWVVIDTAYGVTRYCGSYADASLACHNLNKKFYDTKG